MSIPAGHSASRIPRGWRGAVAVALVAALLTCGLILWVVVRGRILASRPQGLGQWVTVARGDFQILCREDGELRPSQVTTIGVTRWEKIATLVPDGSRVEKGEKLLSLETTQLEDEIQRIQDELSEAERALAQNEQTLVLETKRLDTDMTVDRDAVELCKMREQQVKDRPLKLDKEAAENDLRGAKARLDAARADYLSYKMLYEVGFCSRDMLATQDLAMQQADVELKRSQLKTGLVLAGALPEDRRRAEILRLQAEVGLRLKEIDRDTAVLKLDAAILASKNSVQDAKRRLNDRQDKLSQSTCLAPHGGVVVYRSMERENRKVGVGDTVGPWFSPMEVPNYEVMKVRTQVSETVVGLLRARRNAVPEGTLKDPDGTERRVPAQPAQGGTRVQVKVKSQKEGRLYGAEVIWIDGWARDRNSQRSEADQKTEGLAGTQVFDVEVLLLEKDTRNLRQGYRVEVILPLENLPGVLTAPRHAVKLESGRPTLQVRHGRSAEAREVKLGRESEGQVVVTEGLVEGEEVWVPPAPLQPPEPERPTGTPGETSKAPAAAAPAPAGNRPGAEGRSGGGPRGVGGGPGRGPRGGGE